MGGFFDSFLVMIVVTLGILLVTGALSVTTSELSKRNRGESLDAAGQDLLDQVLLNESLFTHDGLMDLTMVKAVSSSSLVVESNVLGYRILVTEVHPSSAPFTLVASGSIPVDLEELHTARMPINVLHTNADVRAAIVTAWVW